MLSESGTDLVGLRCLLVEDLVTRAETHRRLLVGLGAHVVVAESLEMARRILAMEPFDIAIVEIGLPEGRGSEFVRTALGGTPPPVLFVSGNPDRAEMTSEAPGTSCHGNLEPRIFGNSVSERPDVDESAGVDVIRGAAE